MYHEPQSAAILKWKPLLEKGLEEDQWRLDWTARAMLSRTQRSEAFIMAKSPGLWAAEGLVDAARSLFEGLQITSYVKNGDPLRQGQEVLSFAGDAQEILALERPFLNLASYVCGMASTTARMVDLVKSEAARKGLTSAPRVSLTRKTLPHYRDIGIDAVIVGGGYPHRTSLAGGVLIKENHIAQAGSVAAAVTAVARIAPHALKIGCEVRTIEEFEAAKRAGCDWVLLDHFLPSDVQWATERRERPMGGLLGIEVSGGLTHETIGQYVLEGVDVLSIGALTHTVIPTDLSLLWAQLRNPVAARTKR